MVKKWSKNGFISTKVAGFPCPDCFPSGLVELSKPYRELGEFQFFQKLKILQVPEFFYVFLSFDLGGQLEYGKHQRESSGV